MATAPAFRRPILSSIYTVCGCLVIVFGCVAAAVMLIPDGDRLDRLPVCGATFITALSAGLTLLGIAQVVDYIGRSAFHLDRIVPELHGRARRPHPAPRHQPLPILPRRVRRRVTPHTRSIRCRTPLSAALIGPK